MRMTNKIMQNNSLYNINNNKIMQDKLSTQMSTQKKINRPSDDPVIAIRALRLRSDVSQIEQYYKSNAPDAKSWLKVTGDALTTTTEVLTDMIEQATKGSNKDLKSEDLKIILTQMQALSKEFYSTGNVDYAGRYVFTGYRTDTTLSFTEDTKRAYEIMEQLKAGSFDTITHVTIGDLAGLTADNYTGKTATENDISQTEIHRLRLSYDNTSTNAPSITYKEDDGTGAMADRTLTPTVVSSGASPDPYETLAAGGVDAVYIPETGEVLISNDYYNNHFANMDGDASVNVTYEKDSWKDGDLRPEHYFACTADKGTADEIKYNQDYLTGGGQQNIEYDVGYNQTIHVNTTADEVFSHSVGRNVSDLEKALTDLTSIEEVVKNLKALKEKATEGTADYEDIENKLAAAEKAHTYIRENVNKLFQGSITQMQGALDATSVAITDNGTRSKRLELITNRLMSQQATFKELQSDNEDADISEVAVELTSSELTYNAALMATGKIMQNSLMNYI